MSLLYILCTRSATNIDAVTESDKLVAYWNICGQCFLFCVYFMTKVIYDLNTLKFIQYNHVKQNKVIYARWNFNCLENSGRNSRLLRIYLPFEHCV